MKKALTLSIVIPVYNEQAYLSACLKSLANQTVAPDEVVVVDNNSTDRTVEIAKQYPFVRVLRETKQGKVYARNTGFDSVRTDLIGRIDADSRLAPDWVATAKDYMARHEVTAAITGNCYFYDFPLKRAFRAGHHLVYYNLQKLISGGEVLWGSNMVIRTSAWKQVREACAALDDGRFHEDIDLSFKLHAQGSKIARLPKLLAEVSLRKGDLSPRSIVKYLLPWPKTYWLSGKYFSGALTSFMLLILLAIVLPISLIVSVIKSI